MSYARLRMKSFAKRFALARLINARIKAASCKAQYTMICKDYGTPSVLEDSFAVEALGRQMWEMSNSEPLETMPYRPYVLYVGTDYDQDNSGILQGLSRVADVKVFEHVSGSYGMRRSTSVMEVEEVRRHNSSRLISYLTHHKNDRPFDCVIGQMWGYRMHVKGLFYAREQGIPVVNLAMDDRHAFIGRTLQDGTPGGTLGLVPCLSLACTAAPESVMWYESERCRAMYLPEASDSGIFRPRILDKQYDVCFVGANYGIRRALVRTLERAGISVQAYGDGWPNGRIPVADVPDLFAQSRIVLGCGTIGFCKDFFALKLRDFDGPMSGSLYITTDNPDLRVLYEVGDEIVVYDSVADAVEKITALLKDKQEIVRISRAGRLRAAEQHTWEKRFLRVLRAVL